MMKYTPENTPQKRCKVMYIVVVVRLIHKHQASQSASVSVINVVKSNCFCLDLLLSFVSISWKGEISWRGAHFVETWWVETRRSDWTNGPFCGHFMRRTGCHRPNEVKHIRFRNIFLFCINDSFHFIFLD